MASSLTVLSIRSGHGKPKLPGHFSRGTDTESDPQSNQKTIDRPITEDMQR